MKPASNGSRRADASLAGGSEEDASIRSRICCRFQGRPMRKVVLLESEGASFGSARAAERDAVPAVLSEPANRHCFSMTRSEPGYERLESWTQWTTVETGKTPVERAAFGPDGASHKPLDTGRVNGSECSSGIQLGGGIASTCAGFADSVDRP